MSLSIACAVGAIVSSSGWLQDGLITRVKQVAVSSLDSTLRAVPFDQFLADLRPLSAIRWEVNDCGEGGDGRAAPTCVEAILTLAADTTAHASVVVRDIRGRPRSPRIWDLSIGAGLSYTGFKTLHEWAAYVRAHRR